MPENKPLISVLMPTYNVARFIDEAVESILAQTYENFEFIIVDDCSTDGTYELLQKWAAKDHRIILDRNKENSKICVSLNKAWSRAKGDFIARMDGDDVSTPERLDVLYAYLSKHPDVDLVGSQTISINDKGQIFSCKKLLRSPEFISKCLKYDSTGVFHIWLARRYVYETLKGYRNMPFVEDYDFLLRGQKNGFKYANVEEYVYKVRIRDGNTGSTNGLKQWKATYFVRRINRDSRLSENSVIEAYNQAIKIGKLEEKMYNKARVHMNIAVQSRSKPLKLIYHVLIGMLESRYIFSYIVKAVFFRLLILWEDKKFPRCHA